MNVVFRLIPVRSYDFPALVLWLEQMAAGGLIVQRCSNAFARFRREDPKPSRRYCLVDDPDGLFKPTKQTLAQYRADGWHYQCSVEGVFLFFRDDRLPGGGAARLLYSDSPEKWLEKKRQDVQVNLIFSVISLLLSLPFFFLNRPLVLYDPLMMALMPILGLSGILLNRRSLRTLRFLEDWLLQGERDVSPARTRSKLRLVFPAYLLLVLTAAVTGLLLPRLLERELPLDQWEPDFPLLTLEQLEGAHYVPDPYKWEFQHTPPEGFPVSPRTYHFTSNNVRIRWSTMSPVYYLVSQSGSTDTCNSGMTLAYYVLRFPALAPITMEDLAHNDQIDSIQVPGTDRFWVSTSTNPGVEQVFACRGSRVLSLTYHGPGRLSQHYDLVAAMLRPQDGG